MIMEKKDLVKEIRFSSLSESGFIPTELGEQELVLILKCSHLFQRVASFLLMGGLPQ